VENAPSRPLPSLSEPDTGPFWRDCAAHRLTVRRHPETGVVTFLPRLRDAAGIELEVVESAGKGLIYTYTVLRQHFLPFFRARTPYVVGYVDLDEGLRVLTEIVAEPSAVSIGQRVELDWEDQDGTALPIFRTVARQRPAAGLKDS
jgi:uncharacterized OB-fold protein